MLTHSPLAPPVNAYNNESYVDPDIPFGQTWIDCKASDIRGVADGKRLLSLYGWWIGALLNQNRSITEKMTLFWHNHIAGAFEGTKDARTGYGLVALHRTHALGNFKTLIYEISICPGMLQCLSGNESTKEAPNENYARELQELFTIGKGPESNYTQQDVVEAARVLTGWTTTKDELATCFNSSTHDTADKHFSGFYNSIVIKGKSGPDGAEELKALISMIFENKETALHTCRCLYRWFVDSTISNATENDVIAPLAAILVENNYEIKPVLRALLGSEHFFNIMHRGGQIKNPVDFLIGACRQFKINTYNNIYKQYEAWYLLSVALADMGMRPGDPPNIAGWQAYYIPPNFDKLWINSDTIVARNQTIAACFSENGFINQDKSIQLIFDVIHFASQCKNPTNIFQFIEESSTLLSPFAFDATEKTFLRNILVAGEFEDSAWIDLWNAFANDTNNIQKRSSIIERLNPFYCFILQKEEYLLQ